MSMVLCRRYLKSDGTSAQGTVALAPLVSGLRKAGISDVHLVVRYEGTPLAAAPSGWKPKPPASTRFGSTSYKTFEFWSQTAEQTPPPFEIRIGHTWSSTRLAIPFGFTLLAPALLALWLRRRAERKHAAAMASIWVHWILTGMWLYWISTVSLEDTAALGAHLQFSSMLRSLLLGTVLFAGVPILSVASCIAILMRVPDEPGRPADTGGLVLRSVAREAVLMVSFAMFLVGTGMLDQDRNIAMLSLPASFLTYKLLSWWLSRQMSGGMEILTRGPMVEIASVIARRAGLTLGGIYILGSRGAREANAFAAGGRILALTRGLIENLTARDVVAVLGHEIGHMRRKHVGTRMLAFWAYVLILGPLMAHWVVRYHLPTWILSLPLMPLGYILATAYLSRKHEFSADAQAVELVGDAEGMIAALAHLRQITRSPVDWGGSRARSCRIPRCAIVCWQSRAGSTCRRIARSRCWRIPIC
jgi:Zn-dependent protease with chaperone function